MANQGLKDTGDSNRESPQPKQGSRKLGLDARTLETGEQMEVRKTPRVERPEATCTTRRGTKIYFEPIQNAP